LLANRACKSSNSGGEPCRAPPLHDGDFCLAHSPDHADEVAEARRLGGLRRRRERVASGIYDLDGLDTLAGVRRLLEIAVVDTLGLENSVARSRALAYLALTALKAIELGEHQDRLRAIEAAIQPRLDNEGR
jgi:hypothetical protein